MYSGVFQIESGSICAVHYRWVFGNCVVTVKPVYNYCPGKKAMGNIVVNVVLSFIFFDKKDE